MSSAVGFSSPELRVLILLRHGESESNAAGLLVGRHDSPLTARGVVQAEAAARQLLRERHDLSEAEVVSSPLRRARDTAAVTARGLGLSEAAVRVDERLVELDYGTFDGLSPSAVDEEHWAAWRQDPHYRPPGGEALAELQARVVEWCEEVAEKAERGLVLAVSHVSPIKAAACWALGAEPLLSWRMTLGVAALTRLSTRPCRLLTFGETGHLSVP